MIKLISSKAAGILCKDDDKETYELYEYAIYITLSGFFHILTVFVLGICFNMIVESVVFYGSFIMIRKFAGGYHAKTPTICYLFSVLFSVVVLLLIKLVCCFYSINLIICLLLIELIATVFIVLVSPLQSENKPLGPKEIRVYKRVSIILVIISFVTSVGFTLLGVKYICIPIIFGVYMCGVVLLIRKIQIIKNLAC